jgi:hypothetical protein
MSEKELTDRDRMNLEAARLKRERKNNKRLMFMAITNKEDSGNANYLSKNDMS